MTTLPALEAALDEAAHRLYGARRRRRPRLHAVLTLPAAAACAAALVLALPGRAGDAAQTGPPQPVVPPETLALSAALVAAPDAPEFQIGDPVVAHADLPAIADGYEDETPYPPGHRDTFDWLSTAQGPYDMASVNSAREVRSLVEFRAACIWLRFWLDSDGAAREAAGAILTDAPKWPMLRKHPGNWADVPRALGDPVALTAQYENDCSPWRDTQGG
ncbi:hypothetical protein [Solirubrobacter soli]|uniref:hypothetical protein n=1 Tax=Solirubrobacter soli TaxID=363832 RepID=UPI00042A82A9|nr:hypothetical protein [Solirubrobacter soli]